MGVITTTVAATTTIQQELPSSREDIGLTEEELEKAKEEARLRAEEEAKQQAEIAEMKAKEEAKMNAENQGKTTTTTVITTTVAATTTMQQELPSSREDIGLTEEEMEKAKEEARLRAKEEA